MGDDAGRVDVLRAFGEENGEEAVFEIVETPLLVWGALGGAEEFDDPALDLMLGVVGLEGDDAVKVFERCRVAVELERERLVTAGNFDEGKPALDQLDDVLEELLAGGRIGLGG